MEQVANVQTIRAIIVKAIIMQKVMIGLPVESLKKKLHGNGLFAKPNLGVPSINVSENHPIMKSSEKEEEGADNGYVHDGCHSC